MHSPKSVNSTRRLIMTALFAALACAATMAVRIPISGTGGYVHPGDAVVILSGIILGPVCGFLAAGVGSAMADLLGGYFIYVPITFAIKGLVALSSALIARAVRGKGRLEYLPAVLGGLADIVLVSVGYFVCEIPMYGLATAAASIPANAVQGVSGLVLAIVLYPILSAIPEVRRFATGPADRADGRR